MNAITNASKQGVDEPCDICVYDVRKCFDKLMSECISDSFKDGLPNDKICLIYYSNNKNKNCYLDSTWND